MAILHDNRTALCFMPPQGWSNDPNGLLYDQGEYHLYYQYYPHAPHWGAMHWGHAVSADLLHWRDLPIALQPDELGDIFSGSAVADTHNSAGFGAGVQVAIFTHARQGSQCQSLAWSGDGGRSFTKYAGNPVLRNAFSSGDYRDPKVFWYEPAGQWRMVVSCANSARLYASDTLRDWHEVGRIGPFAELGQGPWECPDLFALPTPDGGARWVLLVSVVAHPLVARSVPVYYTGTFDGARFTPDSPFRWLDWGTDLYAPATYNGTPGRRILLGWHAAIDYAGQVPLHNGCRGMMTLPEELRLLHDGAALRLARAPVREFDALPRTVLYEGAMQDGETVALHGGEAAEIELYAQPHACAQAYVELAGALQIGFDRRLGAYFARRDLPNRAFDHPLYTMQQHAPLAPGEPVQMRIIAQGTGAQVYIAQGCDVFTVRFFARDMRSRLRMQADGAAHIAVRAVGEGALR